MSDKEHVEEIPPVQVEIQHLIDRFGQEIGVLRGQAIVNEEIHKKAQEDWARERAGYQRAIDQLSDRVARIESGRPVKKATAKRKR